MKNKKSGLTNQEQTIMDHIVATVEIFYKLPTQHPNDLEESIPAIHQIQRLIAIRASRRDYPEYWYSINPEY